MHIRTMCSHKIFSPLSTSNRINKSTNLFMLKSSLCMKIWWKNINISLQGTRDMAGESQTAYNPPTYRKKSIDYFLFLPLFLLFIIRKIWWYSDFCVSCSHRIEWQCHEAGFSAKTSLRFYTCVNVRLVNNTKNIIENISYNSFNAHEKQQQAKQ